MEHTPGLWTLQVNSINNVKLRKNIVQWQKPVSTMDEEHQANARLIAAAPELFKALQIISNFSKCQCSEKHGDNQNCAVLVAEKALQQLKY